MFAGILNYFLYAYRHESLLIRHKAKNLLIFSLFMLFCIEPPLTAILYFSSYGFVIIFPLGAAASLTVVLFCLKKGRHASAAQILLISNMIAIWGAAAHQVYTPGLFINKISILFFIMGFLTAVPIVTRTHASNIVIYSLINIVLSFTYLHFVRTFYGISFINMIPYYMVISVSFIIITFSTYMIFKSYWNIYSRQVATEKLLNNQNKETQTNREYEKLNVELVESKIKILEKEERYRDLYENALVGMMTVQYPEGIILKMNETVIRMLGCTREEYEESIAGKMNVEEFYYDKEDQISLMQILGQTGEASNMEIQAKRMNGEALWLELSTKLNQDASSTEAVVNDITYRKKAEENLHRLTFFDNLTNLPNRDLFVNRIHSEILKSLRKNKEVFFAVMCLGVDHFKKINEMHGTAFGDTVLKYVAQMLQNIIREGDVISRYEGDKFQILFSDIASSDDIIEIVRKTTGPFSETIELEGISLNLTASIGICFYPDDGTNPETLIKNSETAMFTAKDNGRNSYQVFNSHLNDQLMENIRLEQELHLAIKNNEFIPYFQPKVNNEGSLKGMESLVRWNSPTRGLVSPFHFIPLAEKNGMINEIGQIMLRESCLMMKSWCCMGLPEMRVAVNISPAQFRQEDLVDMIRQTIEETKLPPSCLELEITESGIMENEEEAIRKLHALHEMGISISIDDFGTGYSSLSKLKDYPIDTVKIDKSFIDNLPGESKSETIATTIIDLAHNLGFKVVAEGVETARQLSFLEEQNCDQYQGYFFSHPLPAHEFEVFYQNDSAVKLKEEKV